MLVDPGRFVTSRYVRALVYIYNHDAYEPATHGILLRKVEQDTPQLEQLFLQPAKHVHDPAASPAQLAGDAPAVS